jgi:hypothetical protein
LNYNVVTEQDVGRVPAAGAPAGPAVRRRGGGGPAAEGGPPGADPAAGAGAPGAGAPAAGAPAAAPEATSKDDALDRLFKYIPSLIIGTYLAIQGVVLEVADDKDQAKWALLLSFLALLGITWLYLKRRGVKRPAQIGASLLAFVIWVFTLGGPFDLFWSGWEQWMGSIALFLGGALLVAWNPQPLPAEN